VFHFDEETTTLSWDASEFRDSVISYDIRLLGEGGGISGFVPAPLRPGEQRIGAVFAGGFSYLNMIYTDFDISRIRAVHTHRVQIRVRAREEREDDGPLVRFSRWATFYIPEGFFADR